MPDIRFIDYKYRDLFKLPDGENIILTRFDGSKKLLNCNYIDQTHVQIANNVYHIAEFAQNARKNGIIYAPQHPKQGDICDIYEIYQLKDNVKYKFERYDFAKDKINPSDYKRVYAGVLANNVTLDEIYMEHNRDNRPLGQNMHSLSVSDIVILTRNNSKTAYYVDNFGFKDLPDFPSKLEQKQKQYER